MKVRKEESPVEPDYPDAGEFMKNTAALGAVILGAGLALGGCTGDRGSFNEGRTGGVTAVSPDDAKSARDGNHEDPPARLLGDIPAEPKENPLRLPGRVKVEPPPLPGVPQVEPQSSEQ